MKNLKNTVDACLVCSFECQNYATVCIEMNDKKYLNLISICRDCADICSLCAGLIARGSTFSDQLAAMCTAICKECIKECERLFGENYNSTIINACRDCISLQAA
jgi:hypothetical protein